MGTVVTICQAVMSVGFIALGITQTVLRSKMEQLIAGHEHEFILMANLDQFMNMILEQQNLVNQIDTNLLFCANNWIAIYDDIRSKEQLSSRIIQSFPSIKSSDYSFTLKNALFIGISTAVFGFSAYNMGSDLKKNYFSKNSNELFDSYADKTQKKIRSSAPQLHSITYLPDSDKPGQKIEFKSHGSNPDLAPPASRESKIKVLKVQEKKGKTLKDWGNAALMGLRIVGVGVSIWAFYKGVKSMKTFQEEIDYYQQYFSSSGDFEKSKLGMIEVMNYVAADIFTLGCASRAAYFDSQNALLVMSITSARYQESIMSYVRNLNCHDVGLTDAFIDASAALAVQANNIWLATDINSEQKLTKMEAQYAQFYQQKKPEQVFLNVAMTLSQVIGNCSLITKSIKADQENVNKFLSLVGDAFLYYRKMDFDESDYATKQKADKYILQDSLRSYLKIFELATVTLTDVITNAKYADIKDILFSSVISFTEFFYYDDEKGTSIFERTIADYKGTQDYSQILLADQLYSEANVIPVCDISKSAEGPKRDLWMSRAETENQKRQVYPSDVDAVPKYRYIRIEVGSFTSSFDGKAYSRILSFEGMRFNVGLSLLKIEESVSDRGTYVLTDITYMQDLNTNETEQSKA